MNKLIMRKRCRERRSEANRIAVSDFSSASTSSENNGASATWSESENKEVGSVIMFSNF